MPIDRPTEPPKPPDPPDGQTPGTARDRRLHLVTDSPPTGERTDPEHIRGPNDHFDRSRTTAFEHNDERDRNDAPTVTDYRKPPNGALQPDHPPGEGTVRGDRMADSPDFHTTDRTTRESMLAEDRVAQALADRGHEVHQVPEHRSQSLQLRVELGYHDSPKPSKNPDLFVGRPGAGDWIDVYAPGPAGGTDPPDQVARNVLANALEKVRTGQAERIHISLDRPGQTLTFDDISNAWADGSFRKALIAESQFVRGSDGARFELRELAVHKEGALDYLYPHDTEESA